MTEIRLHNSRTRRKEPFTPLDAKNVRMYVCGPTVYDRAHLGNARPVVVFDVLYRLLRHVYGDDHVTYVRNFTDVDDKINARARAMQEAGDTRSLNAIIRTLTDETIDWYHADMDALGALRPNHEPRATEFIVQMVAMIEGLVAQGHAYAAEGHVLFDVRSYPDYGKLSGRSVDDMIAGARVEVAPYKRDPMDFVLWKPSSSEEPGWDSPWGRGRPGWHIECSAMAHDLLGPAFDIHGGGIDLQFPHHENEIAQSCCAHPDAGFANFWLHNEMVQVEGKKMSKSLGNFFTVRDLLAGEWSGGWNVPGEVIRYVKLSSHYRKRMDWTEEKAREAERTLMSWYSAVDGVVAPNKPSQAILDALGDDLNTRNALKVLGNLFSDDDVSSLRAGLVFLGLMQDEIPIWAMPTRDIRRFGYIVDSTYRDTLAESDQLRVAMVETDKLQAAMVEADKLREAYQSLEKLQTAYERAQKLAAQLHLALESSSNKAMVDFLSSERFNQIQREISALESLPVMQAGLERARNIALHSKDFSEVDRMKAMLVDAGVEVRMSKAGVELIPGPDFDPAKLKALK